ncbi:plant intracellular ras group-related LRR 1 [Corchorus capsularis]|uniref:Plant intracellular ras group-related LRR 1 n=1 Tax=Corchorus capsularis TaxID=210143 RepID=A0A1R3GVS7_COCAP|nr:plant intracellular ras group-related LRR 1 [Corchorus capsularis]
MAADVTGVAEETSPKSAPCSVLRTMGSRPNHESVDLAWSKLNEIDAALSKSLEELVLSS